MKTELTIQESDNLIELGIDVNMASKCQNTKTSENSIFDLSDIISIIPKEIQLDNRCWCNLKIQYIYDEWVVNYSPYAMSKFSASELIDALYQLLIYVIEKKYIIKRKTKTSKEK